MKTAIIYARVSTNEQSTKVQVKQLEDYANRNGIKVNGIYEESISGAATQKEVLDNIIASEPMADMLIIREVSRLSREKDYINALAKINQLAKNYTIFILADNYTINKGEVLSMTDGLILIIKLYSAADEREKIALRTSEARKRYAENPLNVKSGKAPFGLKKVPNPHYNKGINTAFIVQPDEEKWETVIRMFTLKTEGYSYSQIGRQTGYTGEFVRNVVTNKALRNFVPSYVYEAADRQSRKNNNHPSPNTHHNPYSGLFLYGDTDRAMIHNVRAAGNMYAPKSGSGTITEDDLNKVVLKCLQLFVSYFHIRRDDLLSQNAQKANFLKTQNKALRDTLDKLQYETSSLRKKALKTDDSTLYDEILKLVKNKQSEIDKIYKQVSRNENEIEQLEKVTLEDAVITKDNLETYVRRYIKAIRFYHVKTFCRRIRIEVKEEYLPNGYANYKEYEVYNSQHKKYVTALRQSPYDLTLDVENTWNLDEKWLNS